MINIGFHVDAWGDNGKEFVNSTISLVKFHDCFYMQIGFLTFILHNLQNWKLLCVHVLYLEQVVISNYGNYTK